MIQLLALPVIKWAVGAVAAATVVGGAIAISDSSYDFDDNSDEIEHQKEKNKIKEKVLQEKDIENYKKDIFNILAQKYKNSVEFSFDEKSKEFFYVANCDKFNKQIHSLEKLLQQLKGEKNDIR